MSDEHDVLGKMDALMRKHQPASPASAAPASPNIPTLTDKADSDIIPVLTDVARSTLPPASQTPAAVSEQPAAAELNAEQLEQIKQALQKHLGEIIEIAAAELVTQYKDLLPQLIDAALQEALQNKVR